MKTTELLILLAISLGANCYHIKNGKGESDAIYNLLLHTLKDNSMQLGDKRKGNDENNNIMTVSSYDTEDKKNEMLELMNNLEEALHASENAKNQCLDKAVTNFMTTSQLIALHGYTSESHNIVTEDGYILTVHRIPYSKLAFGKSIPQKTVLLHHGLLTSSADWVIPGPKRGLAYILSDAGYDVWMANVRGNTYSKAHVTKDVNSPEFWNFTFHEVSQYDLPAVIDYIVLRKGESAKIDYVGYSMGTTVLFALLSTKPQYNNILRAGFALAPVAYMTNVKAPFKILSKFTDNIYNLLTIVNQQDEFLPRNTVLQYLSENSCTIRDIENTICQISINTLCGHGKLFDLRLYPMILTHVPAGASTKTLVHYAQEMEANGRFQMFDYGPEANVAVYGSSTTPEYPVEKITLPIALFSGPDDWLSSISDVSRLHHALANPIEHYIVPSGDFNHLDFMFARNAKKLVYNKLLQLMSLPLH